ncbi:MAG: hypothetical protein HFH41_00090 [Lachnospiraceae bacterium]|nr:hypothetical protein [Lachnospiraceae bacterium]
MEKDTRLVNIYIKIHNKHTLTMEDLKYLSKYDPECFEKTCKNLVYKMPETKEILQPEPEEPKQTPPPPIFEKNPIDGQKIEDVLANLRQMELKELPVEEVDADEVKGLLGNLYMELLFPHNDREKFFNMKDNEMLSSFNKKA